MRRFGNETTGRCEEAHVQDALTGERRITLILMFLVRTAARRQLNGRPPAPVDVSHAKEEASGAMQCAAVRPPAYHKQKPIVELTSIASRAARLGYVVH